MKINTKSVAQVYQQQSKKQPIKTPTQSISTQNVDKVEVSQKAKEQVSLYEAKVKAVTKVENEFSEVRLQQIKDQVQKGTYKVNHQKLAESMIEFAQSIQGDKND